MFGSSAAFSGFYGHLSAVVGDFRVLPGLPGKSRFSSGFVVSCGELWTISADDAVCFGFYAGFFGMEEGACVRKRAVEDGKMCG
jgi:hypothetical protein